MEETKIEGTSLTEAIFVDGSAKPTHYLLSKKQSRALKRKHPPPKYICSFKQRTEFLAKLSTNQPDDK